MADIVVAAALEHIDETDDIAVDIGMGILQRIAYPGLGGKMGHPVEASGGKQLRHARPIGQVQFQESEGPVLLQPGQARLLQADIIIVVQIVDADNRVAIGEQAHAQVVADKAGRPRHQDDAGPSALRHPSPAPAAAGWPQPLYSPIWSLPNRSTCP